MSEIKKSCILCGSEASTKEHILPRWLQNTFNLKTKKLGLWNDTAILYSQAIIELCQNCNGNVLSRLEMRIQRNDASENDYYLWALKIRFFLSVKDSTLLIDRKDPLKGPLITKESAFIGDEFVKFSLLNFEKDNFLFRPYPLGSVFLFDNPNKDNEFGFIDVPHPYWGLSISLPNNKILSVLLTDRGMVKREILKQYKNKGGINAYVKEIASVPSNELIRMLMLRLLINQYQIKNIPYGMSLKENGVFSKPVPLSANYRKDLKKEVLIHMCQTIGLNMDHALSIYKSLPQNYQN